MTFDKRHLLKSAYNYTQAGQWDRALEEYRKVTRLFPDDPNIHSMIADLLLKKNDPAGSAREHLESARLFKAQGADDKELSSLRKALRVQAGSADATTALQAHFSRSLQQAQKALAEADLDHAEAIGGRLLDADPGNLDANRLIDDVKAARLAAQARVAMEEEAKANPEEALPDAAAEVLQRLEGAVQNYLAAEDFDNAIETLLVMLKLDPGRVSVQVQLAEAQAQLMAKQAAQSKWQELQQKHSESVDRAKEIVEEVDLAAWRDEEEVVRKRIEEEQRIAEEAARQELAIIETAVRELQAARAATPPSVLASDGPPVEAVREEDARLKALLVEREAMQIRLAEEQAASAKREQDAVEAREREALMLKHAIEMARQEAEVQAKATALQELEARLDAERASQRRELETERQRMHAQEEALQGQMKEFMRTEMARLHAEVREQTLKEMNGRIEDERRQRMQLESDSAKREREAAEAARKQLEAVEGEKRQAEAAARKEREAVEQLRQKEDERKKAFLDEAMRRRTARQAVGGGDAKAAVLKNSRRISDVLHAATTKHLDQDVEAMLETAKRYLKQDLLLDAMRICQTISAKDPDNEKVKALLKEIYVRKGI